LKLIILCNDWIPVPTEIHLALIPGFFVLKSRVHILVRVLNSNPVDVDLILKFFDDLTLQAQEVQVLNLLLC